MKKNFRQFQLKLTELRPKPIFQTNEKPIMYPPIGRIFFRIFFSDPKVLPYRPKTVKSCFLQKMLSFPACFVQFGLKITEDRSSQILPVNEKMAIFLSKIDFFANLTLSAFQNALKVSKSCLLTPIWGILGKNPDKKSFFLGCI